MKNRMTRIAALALALIMILAVCTACGKKQETAAPASSGTAQTQETAAKADTVDRSNWPKSITLVGGPQGGPWYPIMVLFAEFLTKDIPEINWSVIDGGALGNIRTVNEGVDGQIGMTLYPMLSKALEGTLKATEGEVFDNLTIGNAICLSVLQVTVPVESGITSFEQLNGKRLAPGQLTSSNPYVIEDLLKYVGITGGYDEVIANGGSVQYPSYSEMATLLKDRHVDMGCWVGNCPHASGLDADASLPLDVISFSEDQYAYLKGLYPSIDRYTIKAGTYSGQKEDALGLALAAGLIYNKSVPDTLIYEFTKCIMSHAEEVRAAYASDTYCGYMNLDDTLKFFDESVINPNTVKAIKDMKAGK